MGQFCELDSKKGCELLIDTGTYLTYIPYKMFDVKWIYIKKIFKGIPM